MTTPVPHVGELDEEAWRMGVHTFARYISPWLTLVDEAKFQHTVDRIAALAPRVIAGCHTPAVDGRYVAEVIEETRVAPWAEVPPQPDQSVLDASHAALEPAA